MKAQIIQIGNSQGIRIPKVLLEECRLSGEVELEVFEGGLLVRNARRPRAGWNELLKTLAENDEEEPIESGLATDFEKKEWKW